MEKLAKTGLSLKNFTYTNKKIADDIYEAINSTSFLGVSVRKFKIAFSSFTIIYFISFRFFAIELVSFFFFSILFDRGPDIVFTYLLTLN